MRLPDVVEKLDVVRGTPTKWAPALETREECVDGVALGVVVKSVGKVGGVVCDDSGVGVAGEHAVGRSVSRHVVRTDETVVEDDVVVIRVVIGFFIRVFIRVGGAKDVVSGNEEVCIVHGLVVVVVVVVSSLKGEQVVV